MKIEILECGIRLIPESEYDKECLKKIANKPLTTSWEDEWNEKGNLSLEYKKHPWD